jgi:hypothetical protein
VSTTFPNTFETAFEREVYHDYQLAGGQLRSAVDHRSISNAEKARVNRLGQGTAQQKGRHGDVPLMNLEHKNEFIQMQDWYAADLIDDIDEFKTSVSYRGDYRKAAVEALGRREDVIIQTSWEDNVAAQEAAVLGSGIISAGASVDEAALLEAETRMGERNIPQGRRVGIISYEFLAQMRLLGIVSDSDFVNVNQFTDAPDMFRWHGHMWMAFNGLAIDGLNIRSNYLVDSRNTAFRVIDDISVRTDYIAIKDSWLLQGRMSMGAKTVREEGVLQITLDES